MLAFEEFRKQNNRYLLENSLLYDDNILSEFVYLEEASFTDIVDKIKSIDIKDVTNNLKDTASSVKTIAKDTKIFIKDQWVSEKNEIILALVKILEDIQDEKILAFIKKIIRKSPAPSILKTVILRLIESRVFKKVIIPRVSRVLQKIIAQILEKNDALKVILMKYKKNLERMKNEIATKKAERKVLQALVNFGHINDVDSSFSPDYYATEYMSKIKSIGVQPDNYEQYIDDYMKELEQKRKENAENKTETKSEPVKKPAAQSKTKSEPVKKPAAQSKTKSEPEKKRTATNKRPAKKSKPKPKVVSAQGNKPKIIQFKSKEEDLKGKGYKYSDDDEKRQKHYDTYKEELFNSLKSINLKENVTYYGLKSFSNDASLIDDLIYDLKIAGLSPRDYSINLENGTITFLKMNVKLKDVIRQYQLTIHESTRKAK